MAHRTGETVLRYVVAVPGEAGVGDDAAETMTLCAHPIRPVQAEIRIGEQVGDHSAGHRGLAELVVVLEDVRIDRPVRTIRPGAAKFTIVVAVVAVGAENANSHQA